MKKHILIFGAGKSATSLIDYLKKQLQPNSWTLTVADSDPRLAAAKTAAAPGTEAVGVNVTNDEDRESLISKADLVISLLPPTLIRRFSQAIDNANLVRLGKFLKR